MSHSRMFDEYAKLMTEKGLFKTADKKDPDYNTVPDKAGPDTQVEETGWELTEIAHPEQVQVADSRLNDGIVENGVEQQKVMIDVALRNPRGVLASLMQTLVKAANVLEADMTDESLKLAKEVDDFLFVLAQQSQVALGPEAGRKVDLHRLPRLRETANYALERLNALDFSTFGFGGDEYAEKIVKEAIQKLQAFIQLPEESAVAAANPLAQYVNEFYKMIRTNIQKSTDWGRDQKRAVEAWDSLKAEADEWLMRAHPAEAPVHPELAAPGVASKAPGAASAPSGRHFSVKSTEVGQLQDALGISGPDRDEKFGPKTFAALAEAAKTNSLLNQLMDKMPKTYEGWNNSGIGMALQRIQDGKASAAQVPKQPGIMNPYPEGYEVGFNAAKKPQAPIKE